MPSTKSMTALAVLGAVLLGGQPASAGILINPQGIFLTEPEIQGFVRDETGQARFGSPATGFRRFGRSGFFPTPVDPGLPRQGRNAFGGEGFKHKAEPRGKTVRKLSGDGWLFGLFD